AARCLEFIILVGMRREAVMQAKWPEIDFEERVWTIPGDRPGLKRSKKNINKPFDVPLSTAALAVVREMETVKRGALIFRADWATGRALAKAAGGDSPIGSPTLLRLAKRIAHPEKWAAIEAAGKDPNRARLRDLGKTTVHGFRSAFTDWVADQTMFE